MYEIKIKKNDKVVQIADIVDGESPYATVIDITHDGCGARVAHIHKGQEEIRFAYIQVFVKVSEQEYILEKKYERFKSKG
jgi:hypothetical protein